MLGCGDAGAIQLSEKIRDLPSYGEKLPGDAVEVKKDAETGITAERFLGLVRREQG